MYSSSLRSPYIPKQGRDSCFAIFLGSVKNIKERVTLYWKLSQQISSFMIIIIDGNATMLFNVLGSIIVFLTFKERTRNLLWGSFYDFFEIFLIFRK
jgi:hypothetical protein